MRALNVTLALCAVATALPVSVVYLVEDPVLLLRLIVALTIAVLVVWRYKIGRAAFYDVIVSEGQLMIVWGGLLSILLPFSLAIVMRVNAALVGAQFYDSLFAHALIAALIGTFSGSFVSMFLGFAGYSIKLRAVR